MNILEHLADIVIARRRWVVGLVLATTVVAGYGATRVRLNADFATYLNQRNPLVRAYNYIGDTFGGNSIGLVLVTAPDVFRPEVVETIDRLTEAYRNVEGIGYVTSLTNVIDFRSVEGGIEVGRLIATGEVPRTMDEAERLRDRVMQTDRLVGNLVSEDGTAAAIVLRFAGGEGAGSERFNTALSVRDTTEAVIAADALPEGTELYYGGMPFLIYNMTLLIADNMTVLAPLMIGVLLLVLFLGIRAWGGVIYPLAVVLVSTVWTVGIMGFLDLRMDMLSGIMPVILIALGSADGIHFMKRFYERRSSGDSAALAARATYAEIGVPLVVTTLTTMVGFASLAISDFDVIRQFGLLTAAGLFLALVVTLTLLPAMASYGAGRARAARGHRVALATTGLARLVHRRPGAILTASGALVAVGFLGIPRVVKDVDWTLCLAKGSGPFHAEMLIREKFGGSLPVQILVDGDLKDPVTLADMRAVERRLDALPLADNSQSIAGVIAEMNQVMNGRFSAPDERAGVANLWFLIEDEEMMEQLVATEDRQGLVQARLANWHTASVAEAVDSVSAFLETLPSRQVVLDPAALNENQKRALLELRRVGIVRRLQWDLAGRDVRVDAAALEPVAASLLEWEPTPASSTAVRGAVRRYLSSAESEVPLSDGRAEDFADVVSERWAGGDAPSPEELARALASVGQEVDPWVAEGLAWSLDLLVHDALRTSRVDAALVRLLPVAPALGGDEVLRRNVRGTLWEATEPMWVVDAAAAERLGVEDGPAVVRTVETRYARTGMASVIKQMEEELIPTQVESVVVTLAVVVVLLTLIFRSTVGGVLALAPLVVTILVNFGVMGFLNVGLDSFTAMVASIAIGLGIDYAIHFTHRLRRELATARGDAEEALRRTLSTSGVAVAVNAASVGLGFLVLLASGGQHLRRFGGLSSLTMFVAGALTLTLLPALLLRIRPRFLTQGAAVAGPAATEEAKMRFTINPAGTALALALAMTVLPGAARAQDGGTLLARVDSVLTAPKDHSAVESMTLVDADGSTKERKLQFYQMGSEKRLVRFLEPADVRSVGFLRLADDQMYLYLPAFRRVRRIASSIKNEGFMGTDFSYEDLAQTGYSEDYEVTAVSDDDGSHTLTLAPKEGADVSYGRLVMEVSTDDWVPRKIDYFDDGGDRIKTLTITDVQEIDGHAYMTRVEMLTVRSGHKTVLELKDIRLDSGLSDDLFTQRSLKRPA